MINQSPLLHLDEQAHHHHHQDHLHHHQQDHLHHHHQGPLLRLYHTESFTKFIGDVLGLPKLFRLADPLVIEMMTIKIFIATLVALHFTPVSK